MIIRAGSSHRSDGQSTPGTASRTPSSGGRTPATPATPGTPSTRRNGRLGSMGSSTSSEREKLVLSSNIRSPGKVMSYFNLLRNQQ